MSNRSGWAYGDRGVWDGEQSRYLTILGSFWRQPKLYATQEEAETAMGRHPLRNAPELNWAVAHVTEVTHGGCSGGYAYPITGAFDSENS